MKRWLALGLGLGVVALFVAWRWTPLAELANPKSLLEHAETVRQSGLAALLVPLSFVALTLALFPVTVLRVTTVVVFGPILGPLYALLGVALGALVGHAIGVRLGSEGLERLAGKRVETVREKLQRRGLWAIAALRMVPLGPFMLVNAVAGAARLPRRNFVLGTVIGMTPGLILWALLSAQLQLWLG